MRAASLLVLLSGAATVLASPFHPKLSLQPRATPFDTSFNGTACKAGDDCGIFVCTDGRCAPYDDCSDCGGPGAICINRLCYCLNGEIACDPTNPCPDLYNDNVNCGRCGGVCEAGSTCKNGDCDLATKSCGDTGPPKWCTREQQCFDNKCYCINTDKLPCAGNTCPDTNTDSKNCGGCGKACAAGQTCVKGECSGGGGGGGGEEVICPGQQRFCAGSCRDTTNDNDHCRECGHTCGVGSFCMDSVCVSAGPEGCTGSQIECDGECRNTDNDNNHCGICHNKCAVGYNCRKGDCQKV